MVTQDRGGAEASDAGGRLWSMPEDHADLEALLGRLRDAAERLKASERPARPPRGDGPLPRPFVPPAAARPAADPPALAPPEPPPALSETLQALEAASAAVRDARLRVAELQARVAPR